jgi:hypothetical protein
LESKGEEFLNRAGFIKNEFEVAPINVQQKKTNNWSFGVAHFSRYSITQLLNKVQSTIEMQYRRAGESSLHKDEI